MKLFQGLFSKSNDIDVDGSSAEEADYQIDSKYFEAPPSNLRATIRIVDLHKYYKSLHVVRGVNLTVYKDEITALLGHNGAGKTTTMSIMTGTIGT